MRAEDGWAEEATQAGDVVARWFFLADCTFPFKRMGVKKGWSAVGRTIGARFRFSSPEVAFPLLGDASGTAHGAEQGY